MVKAHALLVAVTVVALQIIVALAKTDPFEGLPPMTAKRLTKKEASKHPKKKPKTGRHRAFIPKASFDAATQWPQCDSIKTIRNQGACGDCWAVSSASVLSDRLCIASGKKEFISGMQVAGCSYPDQGPADNCDRGGNPAQAYKQAVLKGFATGGEFQSNVGCVPYTIGSTSDTKRNGISCSGACTNSKYAGKLQSDNTAHQVDSYWTTSTENFQTQTQIDNVVNHMQEEIYNNGPITAHILAYSDFVSWKPTEGPYRGPRPGSSLPPGGGGHAVRITGWGVEKGVKYWIVANSWGPKVGKDGFFYVEMGKNVIEIEQSVSAPIVNLSSSIQCSNAKFCSAPIDQAVKMDYADANSPLFLFQGECVLEVKRSGNKLSAAGPAVPIGKRLVNAPKAPIVAAGHFDGKLSLINGGGEAGFDCLKADGTNKFSCDNSGTTSTAATPYAVTPSGQNYRLKSGTLFAGSVSSTRSSGYGVGEAFKGVTPTAFLDVDGTKFFVFGKDSSGKAVAGVMNYPQGSKPPTYAVEPSAVSSVLQC